ncbi:DUF937 domain-containing protein [Aphanothece hegewaldii CCALA 016]|uniref:DUF937 domain-containing protein n=1 Tax=Aphanothece hegewaldii CCALA 016 TaxID=2107694 RepID=A0A2T1LYK0_9CHRO|nr:DUF937 domain-containing protein [Aphanothece hegewaldii]PSF37482.1 DUF937 domain-containing protein [Aphanothece hegewaldii CCALA 016]
MGLFYDILSSINNPELEGDVSSLETLTKTVQDLANNNGIDPSTTQTMISTVGNYLRSTLKDQRSTVGNQQLENLITQASGSNNLDGLLGSLGGLAGGTASTALIQSLIPESVQQQMVNSIAQKTGLNAEMIRGLIPVLIPVVLGLLKMGTPKTSSLPGNNPILNSFLDGDKDGDVDLGDAFKFASRFIK